LDINGKVLKNLNLSVETKNLEIDLTDIIPGVYFTRVVLDCSVFTRKLVVERE
jgi:hypothetical protein